MWYRYAMEYYSALKRKKILTFATTWMNLEDTVLSEINPRQRDKHGMIAFISEIFKSEKIGRASCRERV